MAEIWVIEAIFIINRRGGMCEYIYWMTEWLFVIYRCIEMCIGDIALTDIIIHECAIKVMWYFTS